MSIYCPVIGKLAQIFCPMLVKAGHKLFFIITLAPEILTKEKTTNASGVIIKALKPASQDKFFNQRELCS